MVCFVVGLWRGWCAVLWDGIAGEGIAEGGGGYLGQISRGRIEAFKLC